MALAMLLLALCAAVALHTVSAHNGVVHVTWTVGNENGWNWPEPNGYNFTAWALNSSAIKKSDKLIFNYPSKTQDVLRLTAANYASCNYTNPIFTDNGIGGASNFSIREAEDYYFASSVGDRCKLGMKFHILAQNVTEHVEGHAEGPAPPPKSAASSKFNFPAQGLAASVLAVLGYALFSA